MTAIVTLRVDSQVVPPWADGLSFALPAELIEQLGWSPRVTAAGDLRASAGEVRPEDARTVREFAAFTDTAPASARLPVSYRRVPSWLRSAVAATFGRAQRRRAGEWARFPRWPLDLTADLLADVAGVPRPDVGERTPVLVTHDIDSPEGLRNLVTAFLPLEEAIGVRSTSYVVPCAWPLDEGLLEETRRRGHGLGVHGFDHSNRSPFADPAERARRLDGARPFMARWSATGYRAPSLLRTRPLLRDLSARYAYDSSIPTSGGLFPVPNSGCATVRPFVVEGVREIPVTLPRDGSLRFLGYAPDEILRTWIDCAGTIARAHGIVVLLTHCERRFSGNPSMLSVYERFLAYLHAASERFAFTTPGDLLARIRQAPGSLSES